MGNRDLLEVKKHIGEFIYPYLEYTDILSFVIPGVSLIVIKGVI